MESDHHGSSEGDLNEPNPAALSFVGGFAGTVTGLKRGGLPGAVLGGVVGGTVGYLAGASATAGSPGRSSHQAEPVAIDITEADTDEPSEGTVAGGDGAGNEDDTGDHDAQQEDDPSDSSDS